MSIISMSANIILSKNPLLCLRLDVEPALSYSLNRQKQETHNKEKPQMAVLLSS